MTVKKLLIVADALNEEWARSSWDERARAYDAIEKLGDYEAVTTSREGRYVELIADEATQDVDLVIVHCTTVWVQDFEEPGVHHEDAHAWVRNLFTRVVTSNRNAQVLTIVDREQDVKYQRQEELRILLLRQFDVLS